MKTRNLKPTHRSTASTTASSQASARSAAGRGPKFDRAVTGLLIVYIGAGMLGAGYFGARSFLSLAAALYAAVLVLLWRRTLPKLLPVHGFLLLLVLLYGLSPLWAADREQAVLEAVKLSTLLPVSLLFAALSREGRERIWTAWGWGAAALTLWGLAFGLFRDGRLESTLGYANAYAVLAAAGAAAAWRRYRRTGRRRAAVCAAVAAAGLLLSGSRAVLILAVAGAALWALLERSGSADTPRRQRRARGLRGAAVLVALALLIGGLAWTGALPLRPLGWSAPELSLRRVYWSDGLSLWAKHWLLGLGGGGYALLYPSVYVKYVHQQFLQMALDVGIFGALAFASMLVSAVTGARRMGRDGRSGILAVVLMAAHLAFDIDMAYPLLGGLLIMLLTQLEAEGCGVGAADSLPASRYRVAVPAFAALGVALWALWLAAGYTALAGGAAASERGDWSAAERRLLYAQRMIPWSHDAHYQLAEVYAKRGQAFGRPADLTLARRELETALSLVPENRSYRRALEKAENSP